MYYTKRERKLLPRFQYNSKPDTSQRGVQSSHLGKYAFKVSLRAAKHVMKVASAPATNMFSPMLNYGLGTIKSSRSGWINMYIFAGSITLAWSVAVWFVLPDDIATAKFLTERQREIATERIRRNEGGSKSHKIIWPQVWEALTDINVWLLFVLAVCA